jgi:hypothetical protein
MIKHGYVERVGNAYRVTDKVNIPDLQKKLQRRIDMVAETAKSLAELNAGAPCSDLAEAVNRPGGASQGTWPEPTKPSVALEKPGSKPHAG